MTLSISPAHRHPFGHVIIRKTITILAQNVKWIEVGAGKPEVAINYKAIIILYDGTVYKLNYGHGEPADVYIKRGPDELYFPADTCLERAKITVVTDTYFNSRMGL